MDLWTILTTLTRRWYFSAPLAIGSVVLAFMLANALANAYTATATVLIASPNEQLVEVPVDPTDPDNLETRTEIIEVNPITEGIGNVGLAAATLQLTLTDDATVEQMAELGLSFDSYTVATVDRNTSILALEADGTSPQQAIQTVEYLISRLDSDLEQLQDRLGAPLTARIDDQVLTRPADAAVTSSGKPRIILGVTLAGLVLTVVIVSAIDAMLRPTPAPQSQPAMEQARPRRAIESVRDDEGAARRRGGSRGGNRSGRGRSKSDENDEADPEDETAGSGRWERKGAG